MTLILWERIISMVNFNGRYRYNVKLELHATKAEIMNEYLNQVT